MSPTFSIIPELPKTFSSEIFKLYLYKTFTMNIHNAFTSHTMSSMHAIISDL